MGSFLGWLHLTDLHQGLDAQGWLWPRVREVLFADLEKLHTRCGPWDFVLFSGDLTQRATPEEFTRLNKTLEQLWAHFKVLGSTPSLLAVPGNHDLARPDPRRPETVVLAGWPIYPEVQVEFWRDASSPYRLLIEQAFANYTAWSEQQPFCALQRRAGILPGDFSTVLTKGDLRLGVVGLNSAFLQLTDANYKGKLAVDVRQLHGVCEGDGPAWVKGCDFTLLMTHHPPDWLSPEAREHFFGEVVPPGRFSAFSDGGDRIHLAAVTGSTTGS